MNKIVLVKITNNCYSFGIIIEVLPNCYKILKDIKVFNKLPTCCDYLFFERKFQKTLLKKINIIELKDIVKIYDEVDKLKLLNIKYRMHID